MYNLGILLQVEILGPIVFILKFKKEILLGQNKSDIRGMLKRLYGTKVEKIEE